MRPSDRSASAALHHPADALLRDADEVCSVLAAAGIGLWSLDHTTQRWSLSDEALAMLGVDTASVPEGSALLRLLTVDRDGVPAVASDVGFPDGVFRLSRADTGREAWLTSASRSVLDDDGRRIRTVGTLRDVAALRASEIERDVNESRLNAALTVGRMVVWNLDVASGVVTRSANAEDLLGSCREPIVDFFQRIHPDDRSKVDWETSPNPVPPTGDIRFRYRHPTGRDMWLETSAAKVALHGERGHIIGLTTDVTERHEVEERLRHAALHDPLTGLLNRKAWTTLLEAMTSTEAREPHRLVVFDIDHFKGINDDLGHDAGDCVLLAVGKRLQEAQFPTAAARLGGDEFAVIVPGTGEDRAVAQSIDACLRAISRPVAIGGRDVAISISAGVARFPDDGTTAANLAKNADLALYAAKAGGRKRAYLFAPALRAAFDARLTVLSEFREGLEAGHVKPFYQPKVSLATGRLVGFEALARWNHPERGLLTPAVFAPVFEEGDLARRLGDVMRGSVLADMRRWLGRGLPTGRVAVNCAASEFVDGDFGHMVLREIEAAEVPPSLFEIEVTEGVMMDRDARPLARAMAVLHEAGVAISLDDFGTGFASLIHLKRFPIDVIKIDRSFVAGMDDASDTAIVAAIIGMGRNLGIATVAEGIETNDQAARLLALGCDQGQGFLFGKPMHAGRVPWFIRHHSPWTSAAPVSQSLKVGTR